MRINLFIILLVLSQLNGKTQRFVRSEFMVGYGFYEGINIGSIFYFKPGIQSVSFSVGFDKLLKQTNIAATASYDIAVFRNHMSISNHYKWHINNKVCFWLLEDKFYKWRALSFIPSVNRTFSISKKLDISFDAGPSFNIVLYSKRKTFEEVGWPYHIMPDFRIILIL